MSHEDIKELRIDIREIRGNLDTLKADVHMIAVGVAQLGAEVRVSLGLARWAGTVLVATLLTGGVSAVWWASSINADVKRLSSDVSETKKAVDASRLAPTRLPESSAPDPMLPAPGSKPKPEAKP